MVAYSFKKQFAPPILLKSEVSLAFVRDVGVSRGGAAQADVRVLGRDCDRLIRRRLYRCRLTRLPLAFDNMVAHLLREFSVVGGLGQVGGVGGLVGHGSLLLRDNLQPLLKFGSIYPHANVLDIGAAA